MRIKRLSSAPLISVALHFIFMFIVESPFSVSTHYSDDAPELALLYELVPLRPGTRKVLKNAQVIRPRAVPPKAPASTAGPTNINRGVTSSVNQMKVAFERPPGLAMIENVGGSRGASKRARQNMILGFDRAISALIFPQVNHPVLRSHSILLLTKRFFQLCLHESF